MASVLPRIINPMADFFPSTGTSTTNFNRRDFRSSASCGVAPARCPAIGFPRAIICEIVSVSSAAAASRTNSFGTPTAWVTTKLPFSTARNQAAWLRAVSYTHLDVYKRQAVFLYDAVADTQPQSCSLTYIFCGVERIENSLWIFNPRPIVGKFCADVVVLAVNTDLQFRCV